MNIHLLGWATGALFFFYAWVLRVNPSVMVEELMRDFSVGATAIGSLSAVYFYGYAGMQIPVGLMIDRFGPRRLLTLSALVCGASCLLAAWSETFAGVSLGRFLIGASAAFSLVGALAVAGQWFEPTRFAFLGGLAMSAGMAGGVLGQAPVRLLVEANGWRPTVAMMALGGVALALMSLAFVRDRTRGSGGLQQVLSGLGRVLANPQTWLISLAGLGVNGTLLGFAGLWGVPFMRAAHGLEPAVAAFLTSLLIAGWGCGAPLFGWLSGRMALRRIPFLLGYAISLPSFMLLVYGPPLPYAVVAALTFLTGFGGSAQIICFAAVREVNSPALAGTAIGVVNAFVTGTGAIYQPLIGSILDRAWSGAMVDGARIYTAGHYRLAFSVLVVGMLVGLACAIAMRETRCRPLVEIEGT
jgi:MFS family permease